MKELETRKITVKFGTEKIENLIDSKFNNNFLELEKKIEENKVLENNLESCYSCENFQDVIDLAYEQKANASTSEFIKCLNYYAERDTFLVDLEKLGFEKTKKKYLKLKPKDYIKMKLKPILYKMNLLDKIKLRSK